MASEFIRSTGDFLYRYFLRFFHESEVGDFYAILNCFAGCFTIAVILAYMFKSWGLTTFNNNLVKNKRRLREFDLEKIRKEVETQDAKVLGKRSEILSLNLEKLIAELQSEKYTATEVLHAYVAKALECTEKYNCCTDFIKEAFEAARTLDEKYGGGKGTKPPLFGVPFSVKDNFDVAGYDTTCGIAKRLENPAAEDNSLVAHLKELGAIPFVKTSVPQTLVSYTCSNLIFGTCKNPNNVSRTSGGSSGGEAALVSSGGSIFGLGSDLAGSLRIPAHFCGIATLKPTSNRLTVNGAHTGVPGVAKIGLSYGYFTRDVDSLQILFKHTFTESYFQRVPLTVPLPFATNNHGMERVPLRIGYVLNNKWIEPVPASRRAVQCAVNAMKSLGHELVPFDIPRPNEVMELSLKALFPDRGKYVRKQFEHESVDPLLHTSYKLLKVPMWIRGLGAKILKPFYPRISIVIGSYVKSSDDLRETFARIEDYKKDFFAQFVAMKLDALICPAFPFPAPPHEYPVKLFLAIFDTVLFNMLDCPAGVLQVTKVSKVDEEGVADYPILDPASKLVKAANLGSEGMPVGVQVVTMPYQEELCLQIMAQLEKKLSESA